MGCLGFLKSKIFPRYYSLDNSYTFTIHIYSLKPNLQHIILEILTSKCCNTLSITAQSK